MSLALKTEEGSMSQGAQQPLENGEGRETDSALGPPEGTQPYGLYDFSPVRLTPNLKPTEL